ncbi:hypothetical protein [Brevundimonas subvibrioides]|uniref:hypothetical protein n=1 Tax=Brevundimonas subvibrioides TaxID=74313 RepID=UPI0022B3FFF9|nr:hypothetical protein [Brevundimonas subvibrioides]
MMRSVFPVASFLAFAALSACGSQTASDAEPASAASAVTAAAVAPRPVMMGGEADMDACAGVSRIKPGRVVLIRSAPDQNAGIVASLPEGIALWVCEEEGAPEGWTGVAFDMPDAPETCEGPGTPSTDKVPVPAVCQSGWAQFGDDVENVAG